jgi:hypothetical protein
VRLCENQNSVNCQSGNRRGAKKRSLIHFLDEWVKEEWRGEDMGEEGIDAAPIFLPQSSSSETCDANRAKQAMNCGAMKQAGTHSSCF